MGGAADGYQGKNVREANGAARDEGSPAGGPAERRRAGSRAASGPSSGGAGSGSGATEGQAEELPLVGGDAPHDLGARPVPTPLFNAQHAERYARQALIREYEAHTGARLLVMIDQVFEMSVTLLEELLVGRDPQQDLHLLLASPGGNGEVALRLVRTLQRSCHELTIVVPDMAKSAATLMCLGADHIIMSASSDLGPIDPQFPIGGRGLVSAKEIRRAVDTAEARVAAVPESFELYSGLLADVNMLMVEQATSALERTGTLMREALECVASRDASQVRTLADRLSGPLVTDSPVHGATIGPEQAKALGLPVEIADQQARSWQIIWELWTRYFVAGCWPIGNVAAYEGSKASQLLRPG